MEKVIQAQNIKASLRGDFMKGIGVAELTYNPFNPNKELKERYGLTALELKGYF